MTERNRMLRTGAIAIAGFIVLAVGGGLLFIASGLYNVAATVPHFKVTEWILEATMERSVEHHSAGLKKPADLTPAELAAGADNYVTMCALCHGMPGQDRMEIAQGLNPLPPLLAKSSEEDGDAVEAFWITKNGIKMTGMPAFGATHADRQIWAMAAVVAELPQTTPEKFEELLRKARTDAPDASPAPKK